MKGSSVFLMDRSLLGLLMRFGSQLLCWAFCLQRRFRLALYCICANALLTAIRRIFSMPAQLSDRTAPHVLITDFIGLSPLGLRKSTVGAGLLMILLLLLMQSILAVLLMVRFNRLASSQQQQQQQHANKSRNSPSPPDTADGQSSLGLPVSSNGQNSPASDDSGSSSSSRAGEYYHSGIVEGFPLISARNRRISPQLLINSNDGATGRTLLSRRHHHANRSSTTMSAAANAANRSTVIPINDNEDDLLSRLPREINLSWRDLRQLYLSSQ